ncbi:MAG: T9SS type A sorting domain-containing protein [Paludibacteraceae bacterium]|nr:T9SS type A sorting domain-containing protein [Paludibacteraceae bacterium]
MSVILLRTKWLATLLLSLLLIGTNNVSAATRSITLDSTFAKCNVTCNPNWTKTNSLDSINVGKRLNFFDMFDGLRYVSTISVRLPEGDRIAQFELDGSVDFYMPDSNIVLSVKNPVYEIMYDSIYIDNFTGYNNPISAEAGTIVNVMFRGGITPGGRWEMAEDQWYLLDDVTVNDSIASFVMPYGYTIVTAAQTTDLFIGKNIECEGGTVRHPEHGNAGDTIWFNVYPDKGYYIKEVFVPGSKDFEILDDTTYRFVMRPGHDEWINVCFEKTPIYHSITLDSTFTKCNVTLNQNWQNNSKGLDSILVGEQLEFMYMFDGLNYESTLRIYENRGGHLGGLLYNSKMGDSIDFFMPDSDIVLSVQNPSYEIIYDSTYIDYFTDYNNPTSAEVGSTVNVMYKKGIKPKVLYFNDYVITDSTISFVMPHQDLTLSAVQTKNIPIRIYAGNGGGVIRCSQYGDAGDTICFNVIPNEGYRIGSVYSNNIVYNKKDDTTYCFVMKEDIIPNIWVYFNGDYSVILNSTCINNLDNGFIYIYDDNYWNVNIGQCKDYGYTSYRRDSVRYNTRVTIARFPDWDLKEQVEVVTESGQKVKTNTCDYCDSVWFFMPAENVYISIEEDVYPTYRSISFDSTFTKCNVTVNPYWLNSSKGLDSILVGERVDFKYMFDGLAYESNLSVREKNGGLIYKHMMGDSVDFFMPDSDIVLTVQNPTYEIRYDSTYINHFNGFSYPISAEAGTTVKILYEGDIIARVSSERWDGSWMTMDNTESGWERNNTWSVSFTMPFSNVLVGAAQSTNLPIYKQIDCGEGQINCPQEVGNARDTIWFSVHPAAGYTVQSVNVTGGNRFQSWDDTTYMFVMVEDKSATINVCFEPISISRYRSITLDSTFAKCNVALNPYWLNKNKGLDSIPVGERVDFMYVFNGLVYESVVSVREKNGGLIYKHMMGDSVDFFMPDSDIVLSIKNPSYEIIYDSTYIDYFTEYGYPISAESGTKVNIMFKKGITPKVSTYRNGVAWNQLNSTIKDTVISFEMPFSDVLVEVTKTTNLAIHVRSREGGIVRCPSSGNAGDTIWFSVVPDPGYMLHSVDVSGATSYKVADTLYAFIMEADKEVWVTPNFRCDVKSSIIFDESFRKNVKGRIYYYDYETEPSFDLNGTSTIDSIRCESHVYMELYGDIEADRVKIRTASGEELEVWGRKWDSASFRMPAERLYISYIEKLNIDTLVSCGKGWINAPTKGNARDTIWFSVHPAVGYHVQSVDVTGGSQFQPWDDSTYMFKLVSGKDVLITACFAIDMVCGCTDPAALNYDSLATVRDNSCIYATVIYGCTDPKALNYDPEATHNSGLCEYVKEIGGCTDASALNYDSLATYNDGSCQYPREIIHGCTDTFALNYNPYAEIDNNTCEYRTVSDTIVGCMDAKAINYNPLASVNSECIYEKHDSVIVVEGCTDPKAANYNEKATKEDGSCVYANPISTYNDVTEVIVNDNQEVVVVVDTVKSIGVVETNGCEIDFAEKIDSVNVKVLSYDDNELITNWKVYQSGNVIYYDSVTVACTEKDFVVLNLSLICNKNTKRPSSLRAKSTMVYAATLRSLVDLRDFGTTTIVLDENATSLYVYPNPASEIVFVESSSLKDKTIQMVNMNGETVKSVKANSNKIQIAISDLIAGEYILFTEDGTLNGIVIVK